MPTISDLLDGASHDLDGVRLDPAAKVRARGEQRTRAVIAAAAVLLVLTGVAAISTAIGHDGRRAAGPAPASTTPNPQPMTSTAGTDPYGLWLSAPETLPETAIPDAAFLPAPGERDQWGHGLFPQVYICADSLGEYRRGSDLTRVAARMFSPYLGQGAPLDQVAFTQYIGLYQPGGANRLFDETRTGLRPCQGTTSPPGSKPVSFSMPDEHFVGDDSLLYVYTVGGGEISASNPLEIFYTAFVRVGNAVVILVGYERQPYAGPPDATTVFRSTAIQFVQRAAPYLR